MAHNLMISSIVSVKNIKSNGLAKAFNNTFVQNYEENGLRS